MRQPRSDVGKKRKKVDDRIDALRQTLSLKPMAQVSEESGVSIKTLTRFKAGESVTAATVEKIAAALKGVESCELCKLREFYVLKDGTVIGCVLDVLEAEAAAEEAVRVWEGETKVSAITEKKPCGFCHQKHPNQLRCP